MSNVALSNEGGIRLSTRIPLRQSYRSTTLFFCGKLGLKPPFDHTR